MSRWIMATALLMAMALGLLVTGAAQVSAGGGYNCSNFANREEAQETYNRNTNDPYGLDGPIGPGYTGEPGVACEGPDSQFTGNTTADDVFPPTPTVTPTTAPTSTAPSATATTATTAPTATATATTVPGQPTAPTATATVTVAPPVQLPGEIAPDAITVAAFAAMDDALAPTITYTVSGDSTAFTGGIAKQADGTAINAAALAPASGVTLVVIDQATGQTIDTGTTTADGLVTLDGEYGVPVFVIVGGTDIGSDAFTIADGGTASVNVVIYRFSAGAPSAVAPTVAAPPTAPAVVTTAAPSAAGGAVTLPNTGTGDDSAPALSWWLALFAAMSAVVIGAGMLMFGRRSS